MRDRDPLFQTLVTYTLCIRWGTGRLSQAVVVNGLHAYESVFIHTSCFVGQSDRSDELMEREWMIRIIERTRKKTNGESGSLRSALFLFCFVFFLNSSQYYSAALVNKWNRLWIPEKFYIVTRQWLPIKLNNQLISIPWRCLGFLKRFNLAS